MSDSVLHHERDAWTVGALIAALTEFPLDAPVCLVTYGYVDELRSVSMEGSLPVVLRGNPNE